MQVLGVRATRELKDEIYRAMNSISALRQDHSGINTMTGVLEALVARLEQRRHVDRPMVAGTFRFFRDFVGRSHQLKEETLLFPVLAAGSAAAAERAGILSAEHQAQRAVLANLWTEFEHLCGQENDAGDLLVPKVRNYVSNLRSHLRVENEWFPTIASSLLSPQGDERLCRGFQQIERSAIGPTGREWYNQLIADYRDIVATWGHWPDVG